MPFPIRPLASLALLLGTLVAAPALAADDAALPRFPTLHGDKIVFEAHGNLWSVPRTGGEAARLTTEPGFELMPRFSPDGKWIAFTGEYAGNRDVYVIPAAGGEAKRLTFHSDVTPDAPLRWGPDNMVVTWTPDSSGIVFLSRREAWNSWFGKLFTVPVAGGPAEELPLDRGGLLSYSPDGKQIAYNRIFRNFRTWKRYDGGLAQDIEIYDFASKALTRVTDWTGTETAPMWYGKTIYFLSDHDEARRENIWAYDTETKQFREVTHFTDYDADFPSLGDNGITFQQGGNLYVLDLPTEQLHKLDLHVPDDGMHTRPRFVDAKDFIRDTDAADQTDFALSPNGKRVLLTARGDIFSLPVEHGNTRDLTETSNADEDHPAWSPDGKTVAYTTDVNGEQQIATRPAEGGAEKILTHFTEGYFYQPVWAPGGDKLAFSDGNHRLWIVDAAGGEPKQIAQDNIAEIHDYSWSPDGRWLAYSVNDPNHISSIWLYSTDAGKATKFSASRDNDSMPRFDPEGKYLYFLSMRHENTLLNDREQDVAPIKSTGIYVATLAADTVSPFAPQSDEGAVEPPKPGDAASGGKPAADKDSWQPHAIAPIHVDLAGLAARAVLLPVPGAVINGLEPRKTTVFYFTQPPQLIGDKFPGEKGEFHAFDLKERKDKVVVEDLERYSLSADGAKVLYKKDKSWSVVDAAPSADGRPNSEKSGDEKKNVDLGHMRISVDPRQEWQEMFVSAWRLDRDMFFNAKMNGVDWKGVRAAYEKLLPLAGSREDLNYLIGEMISELSNSHTYVGDGDQDNPTPKTPTALLGADLVYDKKAGHYVFAKIYRGDNTRDEYRAPLSQPGIAVKEGDYLLAVDGKAPRADIDPYSLLVGKTEGTVRLTIGEAPSGKPHDVEVKPVTQEVDLREVDWIEHNRATVDRLSGGKVAYIYLSDMGQRGMQQFIRQFYNQTDKQALIVDDRFNGGGFIDEIVLARLRRVLVGMSTNRERTQTTIPDALIDGPKVTLINHYSASDGDIFPFYFRKYGLGPLIGTRTWGGVRGIRGEWRLLDGGYITIPEDSLYGLDSQWVMENKGVSPDTEIEDSPGDLLADKDVQLEAGVNYLLDQLKKRPAGAAPIPQPPELLPAYPPNGHD
ncbi:MAG: S41 family peptidase [Aliidongia sp.]